MSETEKALRKEIIRLECEKEEMLKKLQRCEDLNYKLFREVGELTYYIKALEETII